MERRKSEAGKLEEEQETGREERPDACEEEEEEEEDSRGPGSSSEDGMQSQVSRSENLEKLNISRTLQDRTKSHIVISVHGRGLRPMMRLFPGRKRWT